MAQNGRQSESLEMEESTASIDLNLNTPTNDYKYGQIKFHETGRTAEFVKVNSETTNWKELVEHMVQKWKLKKPDLLLSVTGGANNFAVNRRIDGVIREGIVETAVSTNAWLITGGTHAGVMKYVGAAANDYRITVDTDFAVDKATDLITLGVATWGTLEEQKSLLENAFEPKEAAILDTVKPQKGTILDPNHSHFILIDDGTTGKFGADVEPRSEIEQALSKLKVWSSDTEAQTYEMTYVPVVCIMIEGGPNSIKQACLVIDKKTPLVVVAGSGRLSNVLASYFDKEDTTDRHRSEELKKLVKDDAKREQTRRMIEKMAKSKDLLSVYKGKSGEQVTQEILRLLIKANKDKQDMRREDQLRLTQVLNCADIARTELFDPNAVSDWKESELQEALKYALVNDQAEFVKLFLENSVCANFRKGDLEYIYGHPPCKHDKHTTLCQSLDMFAGKKPCGEAKGKLNLEDVGKVIQHLTMDSYVLHPDYRRLHGNDENRLSRWSHWRSKSGAMISPSKQIEADGEITQWRYQAKVDHPFRAIVWRPVADNSFKVVGINDIKPEKESINKEVTFHVEEDRIQVRAGDVIGWSFGEESLTYSGSRSDYPVYWVQIDGDQHQNIIKGKTFTIRERLDYEEYCIEATVEPYQNQQHLFLYALLNNSDEMAQYFWEKEDEAMPAALTASKIYRSMMEKLDLHSGEKTSLKDKASEYDQRAVDVLRHCYENNEKSTSNILRLKRQRWGMQTCVSLAEAADNRKFIADSGVKNMLTEKWWGKIDKNGNSNFMLFLCTIFPLLLPCLLVIGRVKLRQSERRLINDNNYRRAWRRFRDFLGLQFFESPKIKYRYIALSYIAFLILFSYIMLSGKLLTPKRTPAEVILILWVVSLFTEEFRQVAVNDIRGWGKKTKVWIKSYWNIVDSFSLIFFTTGFILRFFDNPKILNAARIIWALDLFIFYTRVLQIFTISRHIGPKLIMIARMFRDLVFFVCILFVFMIGYGVTVQAILYPRVSGRLAEGVLYRPYFQIYGELFLEEVTPNDECSSNQTAIDAGALPCPENPVVGLLLLAGYMVLSNVLLLNLLIAMFSYTFDKVQEENDTYWEFQRYELIKEYLTTPPLVPPLIIIAHFIFFIRWCLHLGNKCVTWRSYSLKKSREHFATASEYVALLTWEKMMSKKCTSQRASKAREARQQKDGLADLESRLESLIENKLKKALKTPPENTDEQKQIDGESSPSE